MSDRKNRWHHFFAEFSRLRRKIDGFRGPGIYNSGSSLTFAPPNPPNATAPTPAPPPAPFVVRLQLSAAAAGSADGDATKLTTPTWLYDVSSFNSDASKETFYGAAMAPLDQSSRQLPASLFQATMGLGVLSAQLVAFLGTNPSVNQDPNGSPIFVLLQAWEGPYNATDTCITVP